MNALTITLGTLGVIISVVCWVSFGSGVWRMVLTIRPGQADRTRNGPLIRRLKQMIVEFAAHTKMVKFRTVGWAHWLVMWGFILGAALWFEAYGETLDPYFHWPLFGAAHWWLFIAELLGLGAVIGIVALMIIRQLNHPRAPARLSRFAGSSFVGSCAPNPTRANCACALGAAYGATEPMPRTIEFGESSEVGCTLVV